MLTILSESTSGTKIKNFRIHWWNSSNNLPDSASKTFWQVRTLSRKHNFIEFLKMKMFYSSLSLLEYRCLLDAPGVLTDDLFVEAIIAREQVQDKKLLEERLNMLQSLEGRQEWNLNLYYTLSGVIGYQIQECRQAIRKATKFSGYVRNSSAVGSKSSKKIAIPEPETIEWIDTVKIDYLQFLTVGEFSSGMPGGHFFTLMRAKSPKRNPKTHKRK